MSRAPLPLALLALAFVLAATACAEEAPDGDLVAPAPSPSVEVSPEPDAGIAEPGPTAAPSDHAGEQVEQIEAASARPSWLGTRELPRRADGFGEVRETPPELVDRRLPPPDDGLLPEPAPDAPFTAHVAPVPDEVLARSTWHDGCPVTRDELAYVTLTFWGFDGRAHAGELLVNASVADDLVEVFRRLYERRFPIEQMRVVHPDELDLPPTGDGNNSTAFVCRATRGSGSWSQHAYGLAVDVNPFHNPYVRDDLVLPELASAYVDREDVRPGMLLTGGPAVRAFADIGWRWGGNWTRPLDYMHFSLTGR